MSFDYYAALGVSPDAPPEVIRAAYRALAQKHHPDRNNQAPEAQEITARLNEAYSVLSDPEQRRAYDETRRSSKEFSLKSKEQEAFLQPWKTVSSEAAGHAITLRFIPGQIISNDLWTDTRLMSKPDTPFSSYSRITSQLIPQQRIGVQTARGPLFVQQTGSHIPFVYGEDVELVQALIHDGEHTRVVAIVNHSAGQWFWIGSQLDAGRFVRTTGAFIVDFLSYLGVVAAIFGIVWMLFIRDGGFLVKGAFIFFGMPALFRLAMPVLHRTAYKLGEAMREKIHEVASAGPR